MATPATGFAGQLTFSSEVQSAWYPREGTARDATENDLRGWSSLEARRAVGKGVEVRGRAHDLRVASPACRLRRRSRARLAPSERWKSPPACCVNNGAAFPTPRSTRLGPANTAFSLVAPERRLSQPTLRATAFLDGVSVDVYALAGSRRQPIPESDGRFGFGVPSRDVAPAGPHGRPVGGRARVGQPASTWTGARTSSAAAAAGRRSSPDSPPPPRSTAWMRPTTRSCRSGATSRRPEPTGGFCPKGSSAAVTSTSWAGNGPTRPCRPRRNTSASARSTAGTT